jgi:hypothetical protein
MVIHGSSKNPETFTSFCFPAPDAVFQDWLKWWNSVLIKQKTHFRPISQKARQ